MRITYQHVPADTRTARSRWPGPGNTGPQTSVRSPPCPDKDTADTGCPRRDGGRRSTSPGIWQGGEWVDYHQEEIGDATISRSVVKISLSVGEASS